MKNTNSTNIRVRLLIANMKNCLTPKIRKCATPVLVNTIENATHYSQSSRENATPSSGTSPLASYVGVPSPGAKSAIYKLLTEILYGIEKLTYIRFKDKH